MPTPQIAARCYDGVTATCDAVYVFLASADLPIGDAFCGWTHPEGLTGDFLAITNKRMYSVGLHYSSFC